MTMVLAPSGRRSARGPRSRGSGRRAGSAPPQPAKATATTHERIALRAGAGALFFFRFAVGLGGLGGGMGGLALEAALLEHAALDLGEYVGVLFEPGPGVVATLTDALAI